MTQGYLHSLVALAEGLGIGGRHRKWGREHSAGAYCSTLRLRPQGGCSRCCGV